jgi:hypothetical protein
MSINAMDGFGLLLYPFVIWVVIAYVAEVVLSISGGDEIYA